MSNNPEELRYAKTHEWARLEEDGSVVVGITEHAQKALGDVVYVDAPEADSTLSGGNEAGEVESVKAASSIYAPLSGQVIESNVLLEEEPDCINNDPYGKGWIFRLKPDDVSEWKNLMTADEYAESCDD